ncbi:hypothetical protein BGX28_000366 [Mortierella sp. GBA30]|nr:hypothetical protein BGX28_000366 [Mortierella sp. GBA30]
MHGDIPVQKLDMEDAELEATFRALRLSCTEEALAVLESDNISSGNNGDGGGDGPSKLSAGSSSSSPTFSNTDSSTSSTGLNEPGSGSGLGANASPKRTKRVLSQLDVNELIQMKITQLESASTTEEDEEKAIAKAMKKIHKEISQVVNGQEDHLGKVAFMQRKYLEMFQDMRKQERDHLKLKKKFELLQREKDLLIREKERLQKGNNLLLAERNQLLEERHGDKISLAKSSNLCRKLEDLCRQIHSDNRRIKEEVHQHTNQISGTFEKAIVEFKDKVEQDIAEKQRLINENDSSFRDKFEGFLEQYDVRERHFNSVVKSKDLELQLAQAKLEQQTQVAQQESAKVELLKSQLNAFSKTEAELRKQLNIYVDKFKQVEETLNKSNSLFQTFRKEMEAMSKKGSSLEKVNLAIRAKCDTMNRNILEMAEERTKHQNALEAANKKRIKLETLCRALHAEKTVLRRSLDVYEARYPELAIQNEENGALVEDSLRARCDNSMTRTFLQNAIGSSSPASMANTGPMLSVQNGGVKQSKLGSRRASITSGKLRQKQKQQHLQMLLQRCEQSTTFLTNGAQRPEEGTIIENKERSDINGGETTHEHECYSTAQEHSALTTHHQEGEKHYPNAQRSDHDAKSQVTVSSSDQDTSVDGSIGSAAQKPKEDMRRVKGRDKDTRNAPIDDRNHTHTPGPAPLSTSLGAISRHAQQERYVPGQSSGKQS